MKAKLVRESLDFKRGINPKKSLSIGKYREIKNPTEQEWLNQNSGLFVIQHAGDKYSVIRWDREKKQFAYLKDGWYLGDDKKETIENSWDPVDPLYKFEFPGFVSNPKDSRALSITSIQRIDPEQLGGKRKPIDESSGVGGYSMEQVERDTRKIIKKEYGQLDYEERDVNLFLQRFIEPAFEKGKIYDYDSLYNLILTADNG